MKKHNSGLKTLLILMTVAGFAGCAAAPPKEEAKEAGEVKPAAAPPVSGKPTSYNVVRGDHLWGIASKPIIYGNPYQWPLIFKANRDKIKDADLIQPGQVFAINRSASGSDMDAAVRHAKTRGAWSLGVVEDSDQAYLAR